MITSRRTFFKSSDLVYPRSETNLSLSAHASSTGRKQDWLVWTFRSCSRQWNGNGLSLLEAQGSRQFLIDELKSAKTFPELVAFRKDVFFWNRGGLCGLVMTKSIEHQWPLASIVLVCFHGSLASLCSWNVTSPQSSHRHLSLSPAHTELR